MKLTPSKALKEIGLLRENGCYIKSTVEYKIVETALKDYEYLKLVAKPLTDEEKKSINSVARRLKALEIIKEKKVNCYWLIISFKSYSQYLEALNNCWTIANQVANSPLTQEEFDLLKEVLK